MSISCQINWACNFIVGLVFPYLQEYLGAYSFVPFAVVLLATIIFVLVLLPETKGTTPEELRDEIVRSLSTMMALSADSTTADHYSSSAGNPIDVEWRRAMDDLRRQEEEDMKRGTYSALLLSSTYHYCVQCPLMLLLCFSVLKDYGFQPIEPHAVENRVAPESDWKSRVGSGV